MVVVTIKKVTQAEFEEKLRRATGDRFDVIGNYIANNVKVALKCNVCGNIIYKYPCKMTGKYPEGCYICSGKNRWKNTEYFKDGVFDRFGDEFTIIGDYVKAREPLLVKHNICGDEYMVTPDNLLRGKGCPTCARKKSKYVKNVESILDELKVFYVREKRFEDCKDIRSLPFDFYIPSFNLCIEVDGEQHYVGWHWKSDSLEYVQLHDSIKTGYCLEHNIRLLRLPYYEMNNFSNIIKRELQANTEVTDSGNTEFAP